MPSSWELGLLKRLLLTHAKRLSLNQQVFAVEQPMPHFLLALYYIIPSTPPFPKSCAHTCVHKSSIFLGHARPVGASFGSAGWIPAPHPLLRPTERVSTRAP